MTPCAWCSDPCSGTLLDADGDAQCRDCSARDTDRDARASLLASLATDPRALVELLAIDLLYLPRALSLDDRVREVAANWLREHGWVCEGKQWVSTGCGHAQWTRREGGGAPRKLMAAVREELARD